MKRLGVRIRLYSESSWSPFPSHEQTTVEWKERKREPVDENGECIVASIPPRRWWTGRSPLRRYEGCLNVGSALHRTIYWLVRPANGALVSCTEGSPDTTPARKEPRGLSQGEGCNPHGIVRGSGERCSLSHSRKLWWNDEGRRACRAVFCLLSAAIALAPWASTES